MRRQLALCLAVLAVDGCNQKTAEREISCDLPAAWKYADAPQPQPKVPYLPNPVFYAEESSDGRWSWELTYHADLAPKRQSTGDFRSLIAEAALAHSFSPEPTFLFKFAHNHDCKKAAKLRDSIERAVECSPKRPCLAGAIGDYEAFR